MLEVKKVHIVSMSHLDVGYTGDISDTLNSYFTDFFPTAIRVQESIDSMRLNADSDTDSNIDYELHYVTHPWIVYLYLNCDSLTELEADLGKPVVCPTPDEIKAFEKAVQTGTITWHAMPMNFQIEFMNAEVFSFALKLTHDLDDRFNLPRKATMSQRDVPGMTRGVIPLLSKEGVKAITVGVNGGVCPPQVPNVFRWQTGKDSVVASFHPGGYPDEYACGGAGIQGCNEQSAGPLARRDCMVAGGEAFCFQFRTDNTGPPTTAEEVIVGFDIVRTQFPGARTKVIAGDLDDFFAAAALDQNLPVVTGEIGDVWIQGVASDPLKASRTIRMQRAFSKYVNAHGMEDENLMKSGAYLLKLTEHTWGLSDLNGKDDDWTNEKLEEQYSNGDFTENLDDWNVQRDFAKFAKEALPDGHELKAEWQDILDRKAPAKPVMGDDYGIVDEREFVCNGVGIAFGESGALKFGQMKIAELSYNNLGEDVYNVTASSCDAVFGGKDKSGNYEGGATQRNVAELQNLYKAAGTGTGTDCDFWAQIKIDGMGAPEDAWVRFNMLDDRAIKVTLQVFDKVKTRFNEAAYLTFVDEVGEEGEGRKWSMNKLGHVVGFGEAVRGGNVITHAVDSVNVGLDGVGLTSFDAPVLSPINSKLNDRPSVLMNDQQVVVEEGDVHGVAFNLWNNMWSTNYMFFYPFNDEDKDISYEFVVSL